MHPINNNNPATTQDSDDIQRKILHEHLELIFRGAWLNALALLLSSSGYVYVMQSHYPLDALLTWLAVLLLTSLSRLVLARSYLRYKTPPTNPSKWLFAFRATIVATASVFGSISLVFWNGQMDSYQAFTLALLIGVGTGALVTLQDFFSGATFLIALILPMAIRSVLGNESILITSGMLELLLLGTLIVFGRKYHNTLVSSLQLRHENSELLANLQREKQQLDNRLGRILNDSSNEIYVVDAHTLRFLQVNTRALSSLGYAAEDMLGMTLPEIFEELTEDGIRKLLTPMMHQQKDFTFYRGRHIRHNGKTYPVEVRFHFLAAGKPTHHRRHRTRYH